MKKKKLWVLVIGIVLICSLLLFFTNQGAEMNVISAKRGDIKKYVEDIGTVKCKEQRTVSIEGSGLIQEVLIQEGQQVKKGDILLAMERKQLDIQLKNVEQKIKEVEASLRGSDIKNYASSVERARIGVEQAKDAYELALDDFNNTKVLVEAGAVSSDELKQRDNALKNAQALVNTTQIDLQQIETNTPENVKAVYKAQLEQIVLSRESISNSMEKQLVRSPLDGIVLERNVEANTLGMPGTVAFLIGNIENVEIKAFILADDVSNIKLGDEVEITERSEKKQVINGKVIKIAPSAVAVTSSLGVNQKKVSITIEPTGRTALLKPGYEVDVRVITERKNNVVLVPLSAVFEYKGKECVFAIVDGKAVLKSIQKGIQDESYVEIVEGLKEGEIVLSEPDINVKEGMRIKPDKSVE
jgi:HlyD family secretion protein